jgi:iron complex outermembrane receptor protein
VPASNAFNPFGEPVIVGYAMTEFGPVVSRSKSDGWFVNLGARGEFGASGWTWEVVGSKSRDQFTTSALTTNAAVLAAHLASSDPNLAFNPFGDGTGQTAAALDGVQAGRGFTGLAEMSSVSASTQGELFSLPGGPVRLAAGSEYREESMDSRVVREGSPDNVQFPGAQRNVTAVFAEAYIPVFGSQNARPGLEELAISLAGRYEHYSDFGGASNPKIGVLWKPVDDLTLRANWGTSFRAPSLRELVAARVVTPNVRVSDPHNPGGPAAVFIDLLQGGNPDLEPEHANTYTVGGEYRPSWLPGSVFSLGYYRTDYTDRIRGAGDGLTPAFLLNIEASLPAGIVTRDPSGYLRSINVSNVNSANVVVAGFDLSAGYHWDAGAWGSFSANGSATVFTENTDQLIEGAPVVDLKGKVANPPKWRGRASLDWSRGAWGAAIGVNYVDELYDDDLTAGIVRRDVDAQATVDLQLSYTSRNTGSPLLDGVAVRVGADNLFDADAPFVDGSRLGLDVRNHVYEGRTVYVRLSKRFGGGR